MKGEWTKIEGRKFHVTDGIVDGGQMLYCGRPVEEVATMLREIRDRVEPYVKMGSILMPNPAAKPPDAEAA
jgi:hypothetical protein